MTSAMGSVDAASVETVAASSDALAGVISSFESTTSPASGAVPEQLDLDLASRAADLLGSIASSAATLEGGLSSENAGVLVNSIDAMLAAVAVRDEASTAMVYDVDPAAEALAAQKAEEDRQQQAATAERLQAAIGSTADAWPWFKIPFFTSCSLFHRNSARSATWKWSLATHLRRGEKKGEGRREEKD